LASLKNFTTPFFILLLLFCFDVIATVINCFIIYVSD